MGGNVQVRAHLISSALAALLALGLGCANIEIPPGGPVDRTPPVLTAAQPDSGSVGLRDVRSLHFLFSEKMDPQPGSRFLRLYPPAEIRKTHWHGRQEVTVELDSPLPADTVVVVELLPTLRDAHQMAAETGRSFPVATADSLPTGALWGKLAYQDKPLTKGVVELFAVPPESLAYFQQPFLRRARTDAEGTFRLPWLPVPGGPWLVRAFVDDNGDLRPGEKEAQRLLPGQSRLTADAAQAYLGLTVLYAPSTPGRLRGVLPAAPRWTGRILAWPLSLAEGDTGWVASPQRTAPKGQVAVAPGDTTSIPEAGPGLVRLIFFVDADGDSLFSLLPGTMAAADTGRWYFEPYAVLDSLTVEPGLAAPFPAPIFTDTLTVWRPAPALSRREEEP
jgi:hypothetical protein